MSDLEKQLEIKIWLRLQKSASKILSPLKKAGRTGYSTGTNGSVKDEKSCKMSNARDAQKRARISRKLDLSMN